MPHFIIDCSKNVLKLKKPKKLIQLVHDTAETTTLFAKGDIKVRINAYKYYTTGNTGNDFIHVFGYIMQGRSIEQKADLSRKIIQELKSIFPDVPVISMNVMDFEKATYCNRKMI